MGGESTVGKEKILLVRAGRGGDLIMITPALDALLAELPEAEFHLLTTGDGRRILQGYHPRLTRIHLYTRRFPRTLWRQRQLRKEFQAQGYDRVFIFETKPHYRKWLQGMALRVHALQGTWTDGHYAERCLDLVAEGLGRPVPRGYVHLPVTDEGRRKARELLTAHGVDPAARLVGLHPTFSGTGLAFFRERHGNRHRMWPAASFARLARLLQGRARLEGVPLAVVVDSLPDETRFVRPLVEAAEGAVTLLSAPPDFDRYKGLLSLLDVLVTPNTGPMHMAAGLNTPLVALFSHWSPEDCGPYMESKMVSILRAEDQPGGREGLAAIPPEAVLAKVWPLLTRNI